MTKLLTIAIILSSICLLPQLTKAETIEVEGVAVIKKERVDFAKKAAIDNALSEAVSRITGSYVEGRTLVEKGTLIRETVTSQSRGFVNSFDVLSAKRNGKEYQVILKVDVKNEALLSKLDGLGILMGRKDSPRVYMEMVKKDETTSLVRNELFSLFRAKRYFLTDEKKHADIEIRINTTFKDSSIVYKNNPITFNELLVDITAWNTASHDVISSLSLANKQQGINKLEAKLKLCRKAAAEAEIKLTTDFINKWQKELGGNTKITLFLKGLKDYDEFLDLQNFFMYHLPLTKKIIMRDFNAGTGVIEIFTGVRAVEFYQEITSLDFSGHTFSVEETQQNRAVINIRR